MRSSRLSFSDPNTFLQLWWKKDGFLSRYDEPQMDELIAKQLSAYDPATRSKTLNDIAALSHDKPGAIYLWSSPNLYAVGPNIEGWEPHFSGYLPVVNVARTG
jgi:ABC-type transport system substrate-binding protein